MPDSTLQNHTRHLTGKENMTDYLRANTRPFQPGQFQPRLLATAVSLALIQMGSAWAQTAPSTAPAAATAHIAAPATAVAPTPVAPPATSGDSAEDDLDALLNDL